MTLDDPLPLLDALLRHPLADVPYLAAGPLKDLLTGAAGQWDTAVAERCRDDELWRQAVLHVGLDDGERVQMPALKPFLREL